MGKILLISDGVPPRVSGSAVIVENLAKQFGPDEMIVVGSAVYGESNDAWSPDWARIHYVTRPWPASRRGLRWWRWIEFPRSFWRILRLAREQRCDSILTVYPREDFLLIGYLVSRLLGADFYPYLHNTYLDQRRGFSRRMAGILQPILFRHAGHIFVMSEGMVQFFKERYPEISDRCSALVHSFNGTIPDFEIPSMGTDSLEFVVSGSIHEICRDAMQRCTDAIFSIPGSRLTILGGNSKPYLNRIGIDRPGVTLCSVPSREVIGRISKADILILPHGFTGAYTEAEYRTVFPTRTIEYLLSGRPILAHSPGNCFLSEFIRKHDCALLVDTPEVDALREAMIRLRDDPELRNRIVQNALKTARMFEAPAVAAYLRSRISERRSG